MIEIIIENNKSTGHLHFEGYLLVEGLKLYTLS